MGHCGNVATVIARSEATKQSSGTGLNLSNLAPDPLGLLCCARNDDQWGGVPGTSQSARHPGRSGAEIRDPS